MPFSHETYTRCIGLGMPEGLTAEEQDCWFRLCLKSVDRQHERLITEIERLKDGLRDFVSYTAIYGEQAGERASEILEA